MSTPADPFLRDQPALRRRYESEVRRLGSHCTDCSVAALQRKFQQELIALQCAASLKPGLHRDRRPG